MEILSFLSVFSVPGAVLGVGVQGVVLSHGANVLQGSGVPKSLIQARAMGTERSSWVVAEAGVESRGRSWRCWPGPGSGR